MSRAPGAGPRSSSTLPATSRVKSVREHERDGVIGGRHRGKVIRRADSHRSEIRVVFVLRTIPGRGHAPGRSAGGPERRAEHGCRRYRFPGGGRTCRGSPGSHGARTGRVFRDSWARARAGARAGGPAPRPAGRCAVGGRGGRRRAPPSPLGSPPPGHTWSGVTPFGAKVAAGGQWCPTPVSYTHL